MYGSGTQLLGFVVGPGFTLAALLRRPHEWVSSSGNFSMKARKRARGALASITLKGRPQSSVASEHFSLTDGSPCSLGAGSDGAHRGHLPADCLCLINDELLAPTCITCIVSKDAHVRQPAPYTLDLALPPRQPPPPSPISNVDHMASHPPYAPPRQPSSLARLAPSIIGTGYKAPPSPPPSAACTAG